jgi:hypothetical protein
MSPMARLGIWVVWIVLAALAAWVAVVLFFLIGIRAAWIVLPLIVFILLLMTRLANVRRRLGRKGPFRVVTRQGPGSGDR